MEVLDAHHWRFVSSSSSSSTSGPPPQPPTHPHWGLDFDRDLGGDGGGVESRTLLRQAPVLTLDEVFPATGARGSADPYAGVDRAAELASVLAGPGALYVPCWTAPPRGLRPERWQCSPFALAMIRRARLGQWKIVEDGQAAALRYNNVLVLRRNAPSSNETYTPALYWPQPIPVPLTQTPPPT